MTDQTVLGKTVQHPIDYIDTFPAPEGVMEVVMEAFEFTSLCPMTGQPDFSTVSIEYTPDKKCIESKSLKLFLWQFREKGVFCEQLSADIADAVMKFIQPLHVLVTVDQSPRGGISIRSKAERWQSDRESGDCSDQARSRILDEEV